MTIGNVIERNGSVCVYDESGTQIALIPLISDDALQGYTASRVTIKRSGGVYSYDEKGIQVSLMPR